MAIIYDGQFKGLADSKWSGVPGAFAACVGVDAHSTPGLLRAEYRLLENSGIVSELCKVAVSCSNGYRIWFSSTSGKIWALSPAGAWSLAYTTVAGSGGHACLGAMEFNGWLYWATESRLHRIEIADADDNWGSDPVLDWQMFSVTNPSFHPFAYQDLTMFIGDGYRVCSVTKDGTFNSNALDINQPFIIKTMVDYELDLLIGTTVADTVNKTSIIRWDCTSPSWNTSDPIEECGINAFIRDDNYMYVNAGLAGNIYFYNGEKLEAYKKIPGDYSATKYGAVNPNSVANFKGLPIFGFSNGAGNPALQGVYRFGSYSRDYKKTLDLSWPISSDQSANVTSDTEVGAILVCGFDLFVAWSRLGTYGVDKIDYENRYTMAYIETMMLDTKNRADIRTLQAAYAYYADLPDNGGSSFDISYDADDAGYVLVSEAVGNDAKHRRWFADQIGIEFSTLQMKVGFGISNGSSVNSPALEMLEIAKDGGE